MQCTFCSRTVLMLLIAALAIPAGCTPTATYPPIEGSVGFLPNLEPIPQLMVEGIWYAHERFGEGLNEPLDLGLRQVVREAVDDWNLDLIFGLDDLRLFPFYLGHPVPLYCEELVEARLRHSFDYAFAPVEHTHPGAVPQLVFHRIAIEPFEEHLTRQSLRP